MSGSDRAGVCIACGLLVQAHFDLTNRWIGCSGAQSWQLVLGRTPGQRAEAEQEQSPARATTQHERAGRVLQFLNRLVQRVTV